MTSTPQYPTTTARIELVKQLRAEAKAAHEQVMGIPGVVAGGILHLAGLCDKAADEIERQDEDRAYGEAQALALSERTEKVTDAMVNRFLSWPLPDSVCSDGCVTQRDYGKVQGWPKRSGTNLLTADEARQMLTHVLDGK